MNKEIIIKTLLQTLGIVIFVFNFLMLASAFSFIPPAHLAAGGGVIGLGIIFRASCNIVITSNNILKNIVLAIFGIIIVTLCMSILSTITI
jgi:hypothetical protein